MPPAIQIRRALLPLSDDGADGAMDAAAAACYRSRDCHFAALLPYELLPDYAA